MLQFKWTQALTVHCSVREHIMVKENEGEYSQQLLEYASGPLLLWQLWYLEVYDRKLACGVLNYHEALLELCAHDHFETKTVQYNEEGP